MIELPWLITTFVVVLLAVVGWLLAWSNSRTARIYQNGMKLTIKTSEKVGTLETVVAGVNATMESVAKGMERIETKLDRHLVESGG